MKKISAILVALLLAVSMVVSTPTTAEAATGWQNLGYQYYNHYSAYSVQRSATYIAYDGGNIGIKMDYRTKVTSVIKDVPRVHVQVFEKDPIGQTFIGGFTYYPWEQANAIYTFNAGKYADGSDGKAEIYYTVNGNFIGSSYIHFLD